MLKPNNIKKVLKFYKGKEYKIIVENKDEARDSNFWDIYSDAYRMLINIRKASYMADEKSDYYNNIIAFVGERGVGKTSCMKSFVKIAGEVGSYRDYFKRASKNYSEVAIKDNFLDIGTIDPSMFDKSGNLLELLITKMFKEFRSKIEKSPDNCSSANRSESSRRELIQQFSKIYDSLKYLNGNHDGKSECIDTLLLQAEASDFRNNLKKLIDNYLIFMTGKEGSFLLLQLDDIDLNVNKAYEMVEQIRKYLILPNVVILIATKMSQLFDIVKQQSISDFDLLLKKRALSIEETTNRTEKYLEKLIPIERRLFLPEIYEVIDKIGLEIYTGNKDYDDNTSDKDKKIHRKFYSKTINDGVRELIYTRTGLYFGKFEYKKNYIIPTNLRELHNFVMALYNMKEIKEPAYKKAESILKNCFDFSGDKNVIDLEEIKEKYLPLILLLSLSEKEVKDENYPKALKECINNLSKAYSIEIKMPKQIIEYLEACKKKRDKKGNDDEKNNNEKKDNDLEYKKLEENTSEYEQHQFEWFKRYFLETWCPSHLKNANLSIIEELYKKEINFKNKYIVNQIKSRIKDDVENCVGDTKKEYEAIMNIENESLNISIGDVLLIVNLYSKFRLDDETKYFCYAIKAIYSIMLYEEYGIEEAFYNGNKIKEKIEYSNYDRLIGGNLYEAKTTSLLSKEGGSKSRDYRTLSKSFEEIFLQKVEKEQELFAKQLLFLFIDDFGKRFGEPVYRNKEVYYERNNGTVQSSSVEINLLAPLFNINTLGIDVNNFKATKASEDKAAKTDESKFEENNSGNKYSVFEKLEEAIVDYDSSIGLPNYYYVGSIELLENILLHKFKKNVEKRVEKLKKEGEPKEYYMYFTSFVEQLKEYQLSDAFFYFSFESTFFGKLANKALYDGMINNEVISEVFKAEIREDTKENRLVTLRKDWERFKDDLIDKDGNYSQNQLNNWILENFVDENRVTGFKSEIDEIIQNIEAQKESFEEELEKLRKLSKGTDGNSIKRGQDFKKKIIDELDKIIKKELSQKN
ncbi:MAG: hypothetical protein N4A40_00745 [Tissierellales bacterium]|jgi:hypothetical protein|nr:hypothetical protein [Tissierellales bacterium]